MAGLTELFQTADSPKGRFCGHAFCPNVGDKSLHPVSCDNAQCKAGQPRCTVCREVFVLDIDDVCGPCQKSASCVLCASTGHKKLFWVEDLGELMGWYHSEGGYVCQKHFTSAYENDDFEGLGAYQNCVLCKDAYPTNSVNPEGLCKKCQSKDRWCMNVKCPERFVPMSDDDNFCRKCDQAIREGSCTSCGRKLLPNENGNMYGHCADCDATSDQEVLICGGCSQEWIPDPVGFQLLCTSCQGLVETDTCTTCHEIVDTVDQWGRCSTCSPDLEHLCGKCGINRVSDARYTCARCQLGVP